MRGEQSPTARPRQPPEPLGSRGRPLALEARAAIHNTCITPRHRSSGSARPGVFAPGRSISA